MFTYSHYRSQESIFGRPLSFSRRDSLVNDTAICSMIILISSHEYFSHIRYPKKQVVSWKNDYCIQKDCILLRLVSSRRHSQVNRRPLCVPINGPHPNQRTVRRDPEASLASPFVAFPAAQRSWKRYRGWFKSMNYTATQKYTEHS